MADLILGDRAAQFDGSNKVSAANSGAFSPAPLTPWSVVFHLYLDADIGATDWAIVNVASGVLATDGWFFFVQTGTQKIGMGHSDGAGLHFLIPHVLIKQTWYMIVGTWDQAAVGPTMAMDVYTGASHNSYSTGTTDTYINNASPQPLNIGGAVGGLTWVHGRLDKVGFWTRTLPDQGTLWNGGVGLKGTELPAAGMTGSLVDYYDLDEATGSTTWRSLFGTHNATATGTVVSVPPAGQT